MVVTNLIGAGYTNVKGSPMLGQTNLSLVVQGTNTALDFTNVFAVTPANRLVKGASNSLSLSYNSGSGLFSGKITDPLNTNHLAFKGAVLQKPGYGGGFFLTAPAGGEVRLQTAP